MKPIIVLIGLCLCYASAFGDVIIKKDGTTIKCYNVDKGGEYIYYTLSASKNAAIKKISREKVFAVKTDADSEPQMLEAPKKEVVVEEKQSDAATSDGLLELMPSPENAAEIAKYNVVHGQYDDKVSNGKSTDSYLTFWGITSNSLLSTEIIDIEIEGEENLKHWHYHDHPFSESCKEEMYRIKLTNKTSHPLYVDLGNTMRLNGDELAKIYFDGSSVSSNTGSESGGSLGLGAVAGALGLGGVVGTLANGVSVGGGNSSGVSNTYIQQRILMIPPNSSLHLPKEYKSYKKDIYQVGEKFSKLDKLKLSHELSKWESKTYIEKESPFNIKYFITISKNRDFNNYYQIPVTLYLKEVIGFPSNTSSVQACKVKNHNANMIMGAQYRW